MNSITLSQVMDVAAILSPFVIALGFIIRQAMWISRLEGSAKAARAVADEAKTHADASMKRTMALDAQLASFREYVAREYTSKEAIRELETRLVDAINRLGDRFDKYVDNKDK